MALRLQEHQALAQEIAGEFDLDTGWNHSKRSIGFLLEAAPDLMQQIRDRSKATPGELDIWRVILNSHPSPGIGDNHRDYLDSLAKTVAVGELAVYIRSTLDCDQSSVDELFKIMNGRRVREICDWKDTDIELRKAAIMVVAIAEVVDSSVSYDMPVLKESSEYVKDHLDTVRALFSELLKRNALIRDEIAFMVERASVSVAAGLL